MKTALQNIVLFLILFGVTLRAQPPSFAVISLEGTAKVQHPQQYLWEKLSIESKVLNDDLVETNFQTKLHLQCTENCVIIIGSNSKVLINYRVVDENKLPRIELSLTVFSGGVLMKIQNGSQLKVFTTNAVAQADSGVLSTVVDGKTGETGFQVLTGNVNVRNITQNKGKILRDGLTTMVLPNKEPTAPLYMTNRHVTVLKHFFGNEYIQAELDKSGVKPTEEKSGNRLSFSQNYTAKPAVTTNNDIYRSLFSLEKIYGSILDDELSNSGFYYSFSPDKNVFGKKGRTEAGFLNGYYNDRVYTSYMLSLAYKYKFIDAGIRFPLDEMGRSSRPDMDFRSFESVLDKVDFLTVGNPEDSLFVQVGSIDNYTFGNGLVVDHFRNKDQNNVNNACGVIGQAEYKGIIGVKGFISDIASPSTGGLFVNWEPASYYLYAGYYYDLDQHKTSVKNANYAYSSPSVRKLLNSDNKDAPLHIYELDIGTDIALYQDFQARLFLEYAQKLYQGNDGILLRMPSFLFDFHRTSFGFSFVMEFGRLLSSQFDQFYISNRSFVNDDEITGEKTLESPNSVLSPDRRSFGISLFYKMNPIDGIDLDLSYKQNFKEKNTFILKRDNADTSTAAKLDYSYSLKFAINKSLIKYVNYAGIYVTQNHTTLYPDGGSPFRSWNSEAGVELYTNPLFYNIALATRCSIFYIDNDSSLNNLINKEDQVVEWYLGIKWGFL